MQSGDLFQLEKPAKVGKIYAEEEQKPCELPKIKKLPEPPIQMVNTYNLRNSIWKERDSDFIYENILSLKAP